MLYADDSILISETIEGLSNKFLKWKEAFRSKGLKVILRETKVMVISGITIDGLSKGKFDPCGVCSLRVEANFVCVQCGTWIHGRYTRVKRVTTCFIEIFMQIYEGNIGEVVEQE